VEELGIPELTSEQIEELCMIAEEAARKYVLSKLTSKEIETLNISAEVEGAKPVGLTVDVDVVLSPSAENCDVKKVASEAVKTAFESAKDYLRELKCNSQK